MTDVPVMQVWERVRHELLAMRIQQQNTVNRCHMTRAPGSGSAGHLENSPARRAGGIVPWPPQTMTRI